MGNVAVVIGATGLVGRQLVVELAQTYAQVVCIVRRMPDYADTAEQVSYDVLSDFASLSDHVLQLATQYHLDGADAFSTLGTTQKDAGSKSAFYAVDYGFNAAFALACQQAGCARFFLLSSWSADAKSKTSFYLRTKGELENAIAKLRYDVVYVFQPSLLLGNHPGRVAENIGQACFGLVKSIVPKYARYRPIESERVAQAMADTARYVSHRPDMVAYVEHPNGLRYIDNAAMLRMTASMPL